MPYCAGKFICSGLTLGIVKNGGTGGYVDITKRGHFKVVITVPDNGLYWVGIANNLDIYTSLENRFVITQAGWVKIESTS